MGYRTNHGRTLDEPLDIVEHYWWQINQLAVEEMGDHARRILDRAECTCGQDHHTAVCPVFRETQA